MYFIKAICYNHPQQVNSNQKREADQNAELQKGQLHGDSVTLKNGLMEVVLYKRLSGWGFAELFDARGRLMGVLEHLGELLVRDQELPMRLEAQDYLLRIEENGDQTLVFSVSSMNDAEKAGWNVVFKLDALSFYRGMPDGNRNA